ncbi:MAG: hypothetical protein ACREFZ_09515 [Acetobacteraceae bacterium]
MRTIDNSQIRVQASQFCVAGYLRHEFRNERGAAKRIAWLARCSHRTVQGWLHRSHGPSADALAEMMRHPKFRERFLAALDETRG